jgi:hypothetical protein
VEISFTQQILAFSTTRCFPVPDFLLNETIQAVVGNSYKILPGAILDPPSELSMEEISSGIGDNLQGES